MANFEPKEFKASDINGGQKFRNGDGISAEAINAPIESALLMQRLATTQPQLIEDGGATSVSIDTTNNKFVFKNIKGEKGEKGEQGVGIPTNMSQNVNKTIVVDGSVVNGNWNATFISQQGGKQRPICTQYTNHTGAKAEMVATANSAKFKFVNGPTDPQAYMEIFEDKINFSKPVTVQGNPVGGGGGGASFSYYTAVFADLDAYNYMASGFYLPDMTNVDKVELDSMVMEMNNGDGSNTYVWEIIASKSFVDSNYMPITVIYANGVWQQLTIHPKDQYDNFLYLQMSINASNPNSVFVFVNNYDDGYTQYYPKQMTFRIYPKEA